jgi:hypothetical protein
VTILDKALDLAVEGLPVFPCASTKNPTAPHGFHNATTDIPSVVELWRLHPGELIGVATGAISGLDVVDLDFDHFEARLWLHLNQSRLPQTRTHKTGRGGLHLCFQHYEGMACSTSKVCVGVDVRADGGYVIWWPAAGLPIACEARPAAWPEWLLEQIQYRERTAVVAPMVVAAREPKPVRAKDDNRRYGDSALRRAVARILRAPNGMQEKTIHREAFSIGTLIAAGIINKDEAYRDLLAITEHVPSLVPSRPWGRGQIREKIERSLARGMRHPRSIRE